MERVSERQVAMERVSCLIMSGSYGGPLGCYDVVSSCGQWIMVMEGVSILLLTSILSDRL